MHRGLKKYHKDKYNRKIIAFTSRIYMFVFFRNETITFIEFLSSYRKKWTINALSLSLKNKLSTYNIDPEKRRRASWNIKVI